MESEAEFESTQREIDALLERREQRNAPWCFPWPDEFAAIDDAFKSTRRRIDALIAKCEHHLRQEPDDA